MALHDFRYLDDVVYFMLKSLRLSQVDRTFLSNLTQLVKRNSFVTTNQSRLLKLLINKYKKQLAKNKIDTEVILELNFKHKVIESQPITANITTDYEFIYFKSPFKKDFLKDLRESENLIVGIKWLKHNNRYEMPFTLKNLYSIKLLAEKHFNTVYTCDNTKSIIEQIIPYQQEKYWNPTLVYRHNKFFIYGVNGSLHQAIEHISLDPSCKTLAELSGYKILVDQSVIDYLAQTESLEKIKFAYSYNADIDYDLQPDVFKWLKEFGCDAIYTNRWGDLRKSLTQTHVNEIKKLDINLIEDESELISYEKPVIIFSRFITEDSAPKNIFKNIRWLNSRPINLK